MSDPWYKTAVMYAIDVARYADSDGDGWGDLKGVVGKLDYLERLGITCLWLLPFFPSPRRDNGYDVSDYYNVDPRFGTLDDFVDLVRRAGERGMRVIIDLVMNHTSDEHPWFRAARADPGSRYHDYYIWEREPPPVPPGHHNAFPMEESSVWTYDEATGEYYYHIFYRFQPQLDASNPHVREEVSKVMEFWLALGVSGFRFDAVPIFVGDDPAVPRHRDQGAWLRELRDTVRRCNPSAVLLGEVDLHAHQLVEYFGAGDQLNMMLDFYLTAHLFEAMASGRKEPVLRALRQLPAAPAETQWVNFLRNLDELNLSWVTEEEREHIYDVFAPDPGMRIYDRGIRRRLAPMLQWDRPWIELAFSMLFSMPGTPMIAYGDEIGLGDDQSLPGREPVRVPMQWDAGRNGGFSAADASILVQRALEDPAYGYRAVNVQAQEDDPGSLLNWVRKLIRTWRTCEEFGMGNWHIVESDSPNVLAHLAMWRNGTVVAVHNLCAQPQTVTLDVTTHQGERLAELLGVATSEQVAEGMFRISLPSYGYQWYRLLGRFDAPSTVPGIYEEPSE